MKKYLLILILFICTLITSCTLPEQNQVNNNQNQNDIYYIVSFDSNYGSFIEPQCVKEGDAVAIEIANQFGEYLGKGLAAIGAVVNPEIFVIGGGVSKAGEILSDYMRPAFDKYAFKGCSFAKMALATVLTVESLPTCSPISAR